MRSQPVGAFCAILTVLLFCGGAFAVPPQRVRGWLVHEPDGEYLNRVLDAAPAYRVNHLEFSHDIVMQAEDVGDDPERARLVESVAKRAKAQGIRSYIWTHEINTADKTAALDPESGAGRAFWEKRREAYRKAFRACPSLSGVVLMFGSSPLEIWDRPSTPGVGDGWQRKTMTERVRFVTQLVQDVVGGELKRELFVRDFNHGPAQLASITAALRDWPDITVISKAEPQDFQPFYPHSVSVGAFGKTPQIIEMDLCGEYWGQSLFPVSLAEYVPYRLKYAAAKGTVGGVGRIDRFENQVLGTPSEVNLFVWERALADPTVRVEALYAEWGERRYGLRKGSPESEQLAAILARTLPIAKNAYYTLGFWTWKSQSSIPEKSSSIDGNLVSKSTAQWDPAAKSTETRLLRPDAVTVRAILAEKAEAVALAKQNVAALSVLKPALRSSDYEDLEYRLRLTVDIARVYEAVASAYWQVRIAETAPAPDSKVRARTAIDALSPQSALLISRYAKLAPVAAQAPRLLALQKDLRQRLAAAP
ncbi:MAG: hypothetical protein H7145_17700 [Akkermansiaceae bacterium]|nr:hypothetical protein [Armatimonadota bacterium]